MSRFLFLLENLKYATRHIYCLEDNKNEAPESHNIHRIFYFYDSISHWIGSGAK